VDPLLASKLVERQLPPLFAIFPGAFVIFAALLVILLVRTSLRSGLPPITIVGHLLGFIVHLIRHMSQERLGVFVLSLSGYRFA
jgi:hypothetical protein